MELKLILRFDDTNPENEDQIYIDAIKEDISWLGYNWDKECFMLQIILTLFMIGLWSLIKKGQSVR